MTVMRVTFLLVAALIGIGVYLTGFEKAHWFLYVPIGALTFAGVTGICPTMKILGAMGLKCRMHSDAA